MAAAMTNPEVAKRLGIKQSVAKEFIHKSKGKFKNLKDHITKKGK